MTASYRLKNIKDYVAAMLYIRFSSLGIIVSNGVVGVRFRPNHQPGWLANWPVNLKVGGSARQLANQYSWPTSTVGRWAGTDITPYYFKSVMLELSGCK